MKYLGMNSISNLFSHQDSIIVEIRRLWLYITKRRRLQFGLFLLTNYCYLLLSFSVCRL